MAKRTLGTKGKGPVKPGNWGYGYLIEYPKQDLKNLEPTTPSCKICKYYHENKYCSKKNFYIPIMGPSFAKECEKFSIIPELNKTELAESIRYKKFINKVKDDILYTGFITENHGEIPPVIQKFNKTRENNTRRLDKDYKNSKRIDEALDLKIKNILRNIILKFIENDIDSSLIDEILSLGQTNREYALTGFNEYLSKTFLSDSSYMNDLNSSDSPYYAVLFFEKIKSILNINIDDLFQVTEDDTILKSRQYK